MPKWNPIFGHLLAVDEAFKKYKLPVDIARPSIFAALSHEFEQSNSLFYVDLWPFADPLLPYASPDFAIQANQQADLDKSSDLGPFLWPITGGESMFSSNGEEWKHARGLFSSGFNSAYILSQTEHVVE